MFCFRDKEEDVHHDFAWTITNFSRKINGVPNGEYIESDKFNVSAHGMDLEWQLCLYPRYNLLSNFLCIFIARNRAKLL